MPLPRYEQRHTDDSRRDQAMQSQSWAQRLKRVFFKRISDVWDEEHGRMLDYDQDLMERIEAIL